MAAYDYSLNYDDSRNGALQDILFFIIGDGYSSSNPNRNAIFSATVQYMGADKKEQFPVLFTAGDKTKAPPASLKSYRRHHHK
jgi:hypothetical protein